MLTRPQPYEAEAKAEARFFGLEAEAELEAKFMRRQRCEKPKKFNGSLFKTRRQIQKCSQLSKF